MLSSACCTTHLCSVQTPGQVGQVSQVGPWNLGSVHLQVPHSHVPLPLQIDLLVTGHARAVVQGAVTGAACPRVVTDANSALATAMT